MPLKANEKILINDRYFLGGPLNLRGFTNRGAGPHTDGTINYTSVKLETSLF